MGGVACLSASDALAKWLGDFYPAIQLLFLRGAIAVPLMVLLVVWREGSPALLTRNLQVHTLRGVLNLVSACSFYFGLTLLPLAEATAIAFAAPLFVIALSLPLLGERVERQRWLGALAGFAGVLIVVRPGSASFQPAALLPLATAIGYALMMLTARKIKGTESMLTTMLYIVLAQAVLSIGLQPWYWEPMQATHLPAIMALSLFSTLGLGLITQGFRIGPVAVVAPFDYCGLIWAALLGWLFWNELPDAWTYAGGLVIMASGLYICFRETRGSR